VKIRIFFAIFRRKLIAQCRSSVRYGLKAQMYFSARRNSGIICIFVVFFWGTQQVSFGLTARSHHGSGHDTTHCFLLWVMKLRYRNQLPFL